jgi:hypothetical protein
MAKLNYKTTVSSFLFALFLTPLGLFGQLVPVIKKSYVYYSIAPKYVSPKGGVAEIIELDSGKIISIPEKVAGKDTSIFIYIETSTKKIKWIAAQQGDFLFSITPVLIQSPLEPGFLNGGGPIIISAKKGCYLFALQLVKKTQQVIKGIWTLTKPITIKGTYANKNITLKTASPKQIFITPPS